MSRLIFVFTVAACGCGVPSKAVASPNRAPTGWILINRPYAELHGLDRAGEARVAPEALAVVIQPLFEERPVLPPATCRHVLRITYSKPGPLEVGETAEAEILIEGRPDGAHVLELAPTKPGIVLLTPTSVTVAPHETFRVRFTGASAGEGGVKIRVRECSSEK